MDDKVKNNYVTQKTIANYPLITSKSLHEKIKIKPTNNIKRVSLVSYLTRFFLNFIIAVFILHIFYALINVVSNINLVYGSLEILALLYADIIVIKHFLKKQGSYLYNRELYLLAFSTATLTILAMIIVGALGILDLHFSMNATHEPMARFTYHAVLTNGHQKSQQVINFLRFQSSLLLITFLIQYFIFTLSFKKLKNKRK